MLHIIRENINIARKINNQFINVDFEIKDISILLENASFEEKETFSFNKTLEQKKITIELEKRPNTLSVTPNIKLIFLPIVSILLSSFVDVSSFDIIKLVLNASVIFLILFLT